MNKDYTVSHKCGIENLYPNLHTAKGAALEHKKVCKLGSDSEQTWIAIDEYSQDEGELTGKYWFLKGNKFSVHI